MSLTLEMRKRQDGFHQQSRHLQATGGQYPFQQFFFFLLLLLTGALAAPLSWLKFQTPPLPSATRVRFPLSLHPPPRLPGWIFSHPTDLNELNIFT